MEYSQEIKPIGLKVYGIIAAECPDNAGETILIDGIDTSRFNLIKDEHPEQENFFHNVGAIKYFKKIFSEKDCETPKQLRCWRSAKVPFLYGEGELSNDEDHPNAKATAANMRFSQRPDIPLDIGWSIDGGISERKTPDGVPTEDQEKGKILSGTAALAASLTVRPCNPVCKAFIENDLTKSSLAMMPMPAGFAQLLAKSQAKSSFRESIHSKDLALLGNLDKLKKSLDDYFTGFTNMRCNKCSKPVRFFKSTNSIPHKCSDCSGVFSMADIWKAINK